MCDFPAHITSDTHTFIVSYDKVGYPEDVEGDFFHTDVLREAKQFYVGLTLLPSIARATLFAEPLMNANATDQDAELERIERETVTLSTYTRSAC